MSEGYDDLAGKSVLVTGVTGGLGGAIAAAFQNCGSRLALLQREGPPALAGPDVEILRADLRDRMRIEAWLADRAATGRFIDVLVNNAAIGGGSRLLDADEVHWDQIMDTNLKGAFFLSQAVARHMEGRGGVILHAASFAARIASADHGIYAASKAALVALTRSMAAEWAPRGIRVNAFSPGVIPTRMTQGAIARRGDRLLADISLHRFGTPAEVADAVLFLASARSSYLTGIDLDVSGGKFLIQDPGGVWR
jgi:NAD(P)-dependent dehydrogenase (short-subunit alcohol dehydrogenase family)